MMGLCYNCLMLAETHNPELTEEEQLKEKEEYARGGACLPKECDRCSGNNIIGKSPLQDDEFMKKLEGLKKAWSKEYGRESVNQKKQKTDNKIILRVLGIFGMAFLNIGILMFIFELKNKPTIFTLIGLLIIFDLTSLSIFNDFQEEDEGRTPEPSREVDEVPEMEE